MIGKIKDAVGGAGYVWLWVGAILIDNGGLIDDFTESTGMFNTLTERLSGTLQKLSGRGRISEDNIRKTVRQIRMALLEADVALPVAKSFVARVRQRALGEEVARSLNPGQAFTKIVNDELVRVLGGDFVQGIGVVVDDMFIKQVSGDTDR